jgi:hypothetical protein
MAFRFAQQEERISADTAGNAGDQRRKLQIVEQAANEPGRTPEGKRRLLALVRAVKANVKLAVRAIAIAGRGKPQ